MYQKSKATSTLLIFIGSICAVIGGIGTWFGSNIYLMSLLIVGIVFIIFGMDKRSLLNKYNAYSKLLSKDPTMTISDLSEATGSTEKEVREDIKEMTEKGLHLNVAPKGKSKQSSTKNLNRTENQKDIVTVCCSSCGAINKLETSKSSECEYCGELIDV